MPFKPAPSSGGSSGGGSAPSNLGGALAASWSPSIDLNINGGSLTLDA